MHSELRAAPDSAAAALDETGIRVAFFSDAFPERNGTGAYYHDLVAQLSDRVDALAVYQPQLNRDSKPLISIPMPGDKGQRLEIPSIRRIRSACSSLKPSIVVVVTPGPYGLLGAYEAKRHGATLICAFHTDFEQLAKMYWNPFRRFFVNLVVKTANKIICRASRSVLINNAGLRDEVLRLGARDVEVIGTPLPTDFLSRPAVRTNHRLRRVCFAGRLAQEKNVEHIISAARGLPNVEFVIGGDGPLRERLEEMSADCENVRFAGWLSRNALIDLIDTVDLLLLPSAFETFGSVALEAMARGRPALVSTTAGIHAWPALRPGLFALNDPAQLLDKLIELQALSDAQWERKSQDARRVAEELNNRTINHWLRLLAQYQSPKAQLTPRLTAP